jgi:hypothetical protein
LWKILPRYPRIILSPDQISWTEKTRAVSVLSSLDGSKRRKKNPVGLGMDWHAHVEPKKKTTDLPRCMLVLGPLRPLERTDWKIHTYPTSDEMLEQTT